MNKPKAVIFDLGKVLLDFDYSLAIHKIAARGKATAHDIHRHINQSPLLHRYETGLMSTMEFYEEVRTVTSFHGDFAEFREIFGNIFHPIPEMITLQSRVRQAGLPCYIFSNTNEIAVQHIQEKYPFFGNFDGYIYSYEHGSMKPHHRLYEVVEEKSGFKGLDLVYIDDRAENIQAGASRGWQVVWQEEPAKTIAALKNLGVE